MSTDGMYEFPTEAGEPFEVVLADGGDTLAVAPASADAEWPDSPLPRMSIRRRGYLAAAALGSAAAALVGSGSSLGSLTAFADDLSTLNCTANDVRIVGTGKILNEPCNCAAGSPFDAD